MRAKGSGLLAGKPKYNQANKIIHRFGGVANLATLLHLNKSSVFRWNHVQPLGSNGLVPSRKIEMVRKVAREQGILLTDKDWLIGINAE